MDRARYISCEECGKHGHIVLPSGFVGPEMGTKTHGLHVVRDGIARGSISIDDDKELVREINDSTLPEKPKDAEVKALWNIELINRVRAEGVEWDGEVMHAAVTTGKPSMPVPSDFLAVLEAALKPQLDN